MDGLAGKFEVTLCYPDMGFVNVSGQLSNASEYLKKHHIA